MSAIHYFKEHNFNFLEIQATLLQSCCHHQYNEYNNY